MKNNTVEKKSKIDILKVFNLLEEEFLKYQEADGDFCFSANFETISGYTEQEINLFPERYSTIIFKNDKDRFNEWISNLHSELNNKSEIDYRIIKKDNNVIWVKESLYTTRDKKGLIKSFNSIVKNITPYKRNESTLLNQLNILEDQNSAKDKFVSIVSHDLRSPFTSILGFSEILMNEPNISEAEKNEYLNFIYESSNQQLKLINNLLDWTRLRSGKIVPKKSKLNIQYFVYNCISTLTETAIRKYIEIVSKIDDNLFADADETLMNKVLLSIINNAVKYSTEFNKVEIFGKYFNKDKIEIVVKDYGIGMTKDVKENLLKIEKLSSKKGTKNERGTGSSLVLAEEIISKHNGDFWYYSEEGKGTEIHFTLPASKNSVLIIDEPGITLDRIKSFCRKQMPHFDIEVVNNFYEAIFSIEHRVPSLIIMEHKLALMTGNQFIKRLKDDRHPMNYPFIVCIDGDNKDIPLYNSLGMNYIIKKPIDFEALKENVKNILRKSL